MTGSPILRAAMTAAFLALPGDAVADSPVVEDVSATAGADGWTFRVTVRHADAGWHHYADAWEVLAPDGSRLGIRELLHPHDNEQPFTRSLGGVAVPAAIDRVEVRARDSVHGWGEPVVFDLPR